MAISISTKRRLIREVREKVGIDFTYSFEELPYSADVDVREPHITFSKTSRKTKAQFISDILHEVVHIWAYRNGYWKVYHSTKDIRYMSKKEKRIFLQTAWNAEVWVDEKAKEIMNRLYPNLKFDYGYLSSRPEDKVWFDKYYLEEVREGFSK